MITTASIFANAQDVFFYDVIKFLESVGVKVDWANGVAPRQKTERDFTIVLGGDGTVLSASRKGCKNPLLVINTGHLGFLSSANKDNYKIAITNFLENNFTTTIRSTFDISLDEKRFTALNDVVIAKNGLSKLITVAVYVVDRNKIPQGPTRPSPEQFVSEYRSDGLIISTPTGSTAYNLSASGPIVHPSCDALVVTPICPHGLTQRPLVLPSNFSVRVKSEDPELYLSVDGQIGEQLENRTVSVMFNYNKIEIVNPDASYFEILRQKLGWGTNPV